jgi:alpha/beta superfamily hydrolase
VSPRVAATSCATTDGLTLEAELAVADGITRAAAVLCHPHPQAGGTMRSIVIGALFDTLPLAGVTCLRFNFRGVGESDGLHDEGRGEQLDVVAAIERIDAEVSASLPLLLVGWSFGADLALATVVDRVAAWLAIAPPLRIVPDFSAVAADPRSKLVVLGDRDTVIDTPGVAATTGAWTNTRVETIGGASHFFVGRTEPLVTLAVAEIDALTPP